MAIETPMRGSILASNRASASLGARFAPISAKKLKVLLTIAMLNDFTPKSRLTGLSGASALTNAPANKCLIDNRGLFLPRIVSGPISPQSRNGRHCATS